MTTAAKSLVWLITGASSGFGELIGRAALSRGDKVIATARSVDRLGHMKDAGAHTLALDVTGTQTSLNDVAKEAVDVYGRVDVVINAAGYISVGALEEMTHEETFENFNTNVFGAINVSRAFLPYLRAQKSGSVVFIGSVGGWRGCPIYSAYAATKYAIRGVAESLHLEIAPLGLRALCFDPGFFRTNFLQEGHRGGYENRIADYKEMGEQRNQMLLKVNGKQPGNPEVASSVIVDVVRGEGAAAGKEIPVVMTLGSDSYTGVKVYCEDTLKRLEEWKDVAFSTDFPKGT